MGVVPTEGDELARQLASVAGRSTLRITTRGRRTGKRHSVPIWFAVDGAKVVFGTLNAERDWVRNAKKNPEVELQVADLHLRGRFSVVTNGTQAAEVRRLIGGKYWIARIASWFGFTSQEVFAVDELAPIAV
jgi:F420H(2)-dependent quinone reductase